MQLLKKWLLENAVLTAKSNHSEATYWNIGSLAARVACHLKDFESTPLQILYDPEVSNVFVVSFKGNLRLFKTFSSLEVYLNAFATVFSSNKGCKSILEFGEPKVSIPINYDAKLFASILQKTNIKGLPLVKQELDLLATLGVYIDSEKKTIEKVDLNKLKK